MPHRIPPSKRHQPVRVGACVLVGLKTPAILQEFDDPLPAASNGVTLARGTTFRIRREPLLSPM